MASNPPPVRAPPRPPIRTAPGDGPERALQRSLCRPQPNRGLMQCQPVRISVGYRRTQIFQRAPQYGLLVCVGHRDQAVPNYCGCRSPWAHGSYCRLRGDGMREIVELCWSHEQDSAGFCCVGFYILRGLPDPSQAQGCGRQADVCQVTPIFCAVWGHPFLRTRPAQFGLMSSFPVWRG